MGELAKTRQHWQVAQEELGRLSASRTAAEVARADAQMSRKALQKEREWRQKISEVWDGSHLHSNVRGGSHATLEGRGAVSC